MSGLNIFGFLLVLIVAFYFIIHFLTKRLGGKLQRLFVSSYVVVLIGATIFVLFTKNDMQVLSEEVYNETKKENIALQKKLFQHELNQIPVSFLVKEWHQQIDETKTFSLVDRSASPVGVVVERVKNLDDKIHVHVYKPQIFAGRLRINEQARVADVKTTKNELRFICTEEKPVPIITVVSDASPFIENTSKYETFEIYKERYAKYTYEEYEVLVHLQIPENVKLKNEDLLILNR